MNPLGYLPKRCPCCNRLKFRKDIISRRLNTAYVDTDSNWLTSCEMCYDEAIAYYVERWSEYYSGLL